MSTLCFYPAASKNNGNRWGRGMRVAARRTIPEGLDVCRQVCSGGLGRREMPALPHNPQTGIPEECDHCSHAHRNNAIICASVFTPVVAFLSKFAEDCDEVA